MNKSNVTLYENPEEAESSSMANETEDVTGDGEAKSMEENGTAKDGEKLSMSFYGILWGLQSLFNDPSLLNQQDKFLQLVKGVETVLDAFDNNKLSSLGMHSVQYSKDNHYMHKIVQKLVLFACFLFYTYVHVVVWHQELLELVNMKGILRVPRQTKKAFGPLTHHTN